MFLCMTLEIYKSGEAFIACLTGWASALALKTAVGADRRVCCDIMLLVGVCTDVGVPALELDKVRGGLLLLAAA